jgi:hypothetical protein
MIGQVSEERLIMNSAYIFAGQEASGCVVSFNCDPEKAAEKATESVER